jgi:hypothetical protein
MAAAALIVVACRGEGLEPADLPADVRSDYALFAQRCSKCHSLDRPLGSGISDDAFWKKYVEQMRLKPGSGISLDDEPHILHFLHYYSASRRAAPEGGAVAP